MADLPTCTEPAGHDPCQCGDFTFVHSPDLLLRLPKDYHGEECPRCSMWMVRIDKIKELPMPDDLNHRTEMAFAEWSRANDEFREAARKLQAARERYEKLENERSARRA